LPACDDCHQAHTIARVDLSDFRQGIIGQCETCHREVTATYFDTLHGKVAKLGSAKTARCHDCHGSHDILPTEDPASRLSRGKVIETCRQCHPSSNRKFVGYLTHATHHDRQRYPYLFYSFWGMTALLIGTFVFFGLHTLLWLPRNLREWWRRRKDPRPEAHRYIQRFDAYSRFLHVLVVVSFLTLAITGMTLKFAEVGLFQTVSRFLGGFEVTGFLHRAAALVTFAYFFLHLLYLGHKLRNRTLRLRELFHGEDSLVPGLADVRDFLATMRWFLGLGPRPAYGRWTYWEKFDYFAVFWGIFVIGLSGLLLWFSEFFTSVFGLPGWLLNVATIIHSDEALLATGFIFTVHFFNTHFRPDRFPMDPVIFTGRVSVAELQHERPRQFEAMGGDEGVRSRLVSPPSLFLTRLSTIFGLSALVVGLTTVLMVLYAMLYLYR